MTTPETLATTARRTMTFELVAAAGVAHGSSGRGRGGDRRPRGREGGEEGHFRALLVRRPRSESRAIPCPLAAEYLRVAVSRDERHLLSLEVLRASWTRAAHPWPHGSWAWSSATLTSLRLRRAADSARCAQLARVRCTNTVGSCNVEKPVSFAADLPFLCACEQCVRTSKAVGDLRSGIWICRDAV